jgi:uncharacterized Rossmann fold enzyme
MKPVKYDEWEPVYHEICEYFSFDQNEDTRAAERAAELSSSDALSGLVSSIRDRSVTVCGNAPGLQNQLGLISGTVIAADGAAGVLLKNDVIPDVIVTDLDGIDDYAIGLNESGTILVVHAHGDNIPRLERWLPCLTGPVLLTTQGKPFAHLYNFGGFSDGDRAVFMAKELGAASIAIIGFDCDDPGVSPIKKGKLIWARKLLAMIGYEC